MFFVQKYTDWYIYIYINSFFMYQFILVISVVKFSLKIVKINVTTIKFKFD